MAEVNTSPQASSIFGTFDLNAGIFGSYDEGAQTERHAANQDVVWGTFAELYVSGATVYGLINPSLYTTELIGVVVQTTNSPQASIAAYTTAAGYMGAVAKRGKVVCRMDTTNKPNVGQAVSVNLNAGKIGYVTGLTSGGVLNLAKASARVSAVYDTHCEVELSGDAALSATYAT